MHQFTFGNRRNPCQCDIVFTPMFHCWSINGRSSCLVFDFLHGIQLIGDVCSRLIIFVLDSHKCFHWNVASHNLWNWTKSSILSKHIVLVMSFKCQLCHFSEMNESSNKIRLHETIIIYREKPFTQTITTLN